MVKTTTRRTANVRIPATGAPSAATHGMDVIDSDIARRIRAEYLEMPGMSLKAEQVQRLCGVERTVCKEMLDALVEANFLYVKPDGGYARVTDGVIVSSRPLESVTSRRGRRRTRSSSDESR